VSEAFTEILGTAERAAAGSEADKSTLARLLDGVDLAGLGGPADRAYLAALLDWAGMREHAMLALRPGRGEQGDQDARMPNLAGLLSSGHGEYRQARKLFAEALSVASDGTHLRVKILANLAALSLLVGDLGAASMWMGRSRAAQRQAGDPATDVLLASTEFGIAREQDDLGGMRGAVSRLNEATRARIEELGPDHQLALTAVASLAAAEFDLASAEASVENQERAIAVIEVAAHRLAADLGADHPQALTCLENLCVAAFSLARASESLDRLSHAAEMLESVSRQTTAALGEGHPRARAAAANAASAGLELREARRLREEASPAEATSSENLADTTDAPIAAESQSLGHSVKARPDAFTPGPRTRPAERVSSLARTGQAGDDVTRQNSARRTLATSDTRVVQYEPLLAPASLLHELPLRDEVEAMVERTRAEVRAVLDGTDDRLLVVTGPCSIHDPVAALEYAGRLSGLRDRYSGDLLVVMRTYFEKPRTVFGWRGLINDPGMNESHDVHRGLRTARRLLLDILALGMPVGCEWLDPITPQYMADTASWGAIGARTTESQVHRQLASGLSMPVGFKNGTDGDVEVAVDACLAAAAGHTFFGVTAAGAAAVVTTAGNPDTHVILRGGRSGPNFYAQHVTKALDLLHASGLPPRLMVDASHGNSGKNYHHQTPVAATVAQQAAAGERGVIGLMLESFLVAGRQNPGDPATLTYGQSVTDACMDIEATHAVLDNLADAVRLRRLH
jgi:3-deoxy-7-phosphoheptulonate synthase